MKNTTRFSIRSWLFLCSFLLIVSCKKNHEDTLPGNDQTSAYSSEVAQKWQEMQVRIFRQPAGPNIFGLHGIRYFAYCGIALYEAVVPGMPGYQTLTGQLTDMPAMPVTETGKTYHWPTCANAALAFLNRNFFTGTTDANKASMDSLENAVNSAFQAEIDPAEFQRSADFGKTVAQRIFDWSKTDGSLDVNPPYIPPVGPGLWAPTPPDFAAAFGPYWGNIKPMVPGSLTGAEPPLPPAYSTDPNSAYYAMVKEVYDISVNLTPEQTATALYFRDNPGFRAGTNYVYTFNQILHDENPQLDFFALANAKTGISLYEALRACWLIKYRHNVDRPIRYIREVLNHPSWNPLFSTPNHPDYPSGHSTNGGAFAAVFSSLFGGNYKFTLHTYDNLDMAPRSYNSFNEMADDIGKSRVYAGIHYTYSCEKGRMQGAKIAANVLNILKFKK